MANSALKDKIYKISPEYSKKLGEELSYSAIKMKISRMENNMKSPDFIKWGGVKVLDYLKSLINGERKEVKDKKEKCRDSGQENCYIENHEKDKKNKNITAIGGIPLLWKGNIKTDIYSNKSVYNEQLKIELDRITDLINKI